MSQDEGVGKDEGLIFFRTPDQLEEFDRIKDVVDRVMLRKDPAEALAADAYEANLARNSGGAHVTGPRGGGAATGKADGATSAALSSSAARRAAVLPISRNRKKKNDASGGAERGGGGGGGGDKSAGALHPGKLNQSSANSNKSPNVSDVSCKDGRSFPKRSSSIGTRYQVSHIPQAGTFDPTKPPESEQ